MKNERMILTIKADDRPGLLHLLTGVLNRKLIPITSLTAAPTDIHDIVLVTMEITITEKALQPLLYKLESIVEVFSVEAASAKKALCQRAAYFSLNKLLLVTPQAIAITKYDAQIVNLKADIVVVAKSGSEAIIRQLYNALEGPYLLGFSQTGLITDSTLIVHEDIERINGLAA